MGFTVRAHVRHARGPGGIKSVTVDASKLAGSRMTPLHDDGKSDDEKAGDGIYGALIRFSPAVFGQQGFREMLLLNVTATDTNGLRDSWPAAVSVPRGPAVISLMAGGWDSERTEGPVTARMVHDRSLGDRTNVIRFAVTGTGPWRAAWLVPGDGVNSAGLRWLTFHINGDTSQELFVHLVDHHKIGSEGFFDEPHFSAPVPLIAGGYVKAITPSYQKVRIPIARLLPKGVLFLRWHTAGIGLSGPREGKAATYHIHLAQIEP